MKRIVIVLLALLLVGCETYYKSTEPVGTPQKIDAKIEFVEDESASIFVNVAIEDQSLAYGAIKLIFEQPQLHEGYFLDYKSYQTTSVLTRHLVDGNAEIALVSLSTALNVNSLGGRYKLVGIVHGEPLRLYSKRNVNGLDSFSGQEIHLLNEDLQHVSAILMSQGIHPQTDVKLTVWNNLDALEEAYLHGRVINLATKNDMPGEFLDLSVYLEKAFGYAKGYPKGVLLVRDPIHISYSDLIVEVYTALDEGIEWLNTSEEIAISYAQQLGISSKNKATGLSFAYEDMPALLKYFQGIHRVGAELLVPDESYFYIPGGQH